MTSQIDTARPSDAAIAYLREHEEEHLAQLAEFLSIESVSADPGRAGDVRRAAEWIVDELTRLGMERATIHETSHHPIVTGEWLQAGPDAPTVLVYCHYDVQPADPLDEWIGPPFEPRHEDDCVFARGAGDDKGQLFMHLKAVEAWASSGRPTSARSRCARCLPSATSSSSGRSSPSPPTPGCWRRRPWRSSQRTRTSTGRGGRARRDPPVGADHAPHDHSLGDHHRRRGRDGIGASAGGRGMTP